MSEVRPISPDVAAELAGARPRSGDAAAERKVMEAKVFSQDEVGIKVHWTVEGESFEELAKNVTSLLGWLDAHEFKGDSGFGNGASTVSRQQAESPKTDVTCRFCNGPVWDNRESKRSESAPDYKCKDRQKCDAAAWVQEDGELKWTKGRAR